MRLEVKLFCTNYERGIKVLIEGVTSVELVVGSPFIVEVGHFGEGQPTHLSHQLGIHWKPQRNM